VVPTAETEAAAGTRFPQMSYLEIWPSARCSQCSKPKEKKCHGWKFEAELLGDWRSATGQAHWKPMADHLPFSGNNFVGFLSAKGAR
jgi:hypothetical protein